MSKLILVAVFINSLTPTAYRSTPKQCKPKGYEWTASGERCNIHGCAVSQDLLKRNGGPLQYGDMIYIEGIGLKFVNDTMASRHKQRIDIWVENRLEEHKFEIKYKQKPLKVWKITFEVAP